MSIAETSSALEVLTENPSAALAVVVVVGFLVLKTAAKLAIKALFVGVILLLGWSATRDNGQVDVASTNTEAVQTVDSDDASLVSGFMPPEYMQDAAENLVDAARSEEGREVISDAVDAVKDTVSSDTVKDTVGGLLGGIKDVISGD